MKYNIYVSLLSSIPQKNPQNTTGLTDRTPTSPIETRISRISGNFGKISQNSLNFAARVGLGAAQKSDTHQKTTANKARRGFVNFI